MSKKSIENSPQFMNVQQAADFLGVNVGTIRRWAHTNQLKGIKLGIRGDWRFTKDELLKMAQGNHHTPHDSFNNDIANIMQKIDDIQSINNNYKIEQGTSEHSIHFEKKQNNENLLLINDSSSDEEKLELITTPYVNLNHMSEYEHFVQFYEEDSFLINSIREFIHKGDVTIVVTTPEHRQTLEEALELYNDLASAYTERQYILLDAAELLSKFMVNGSIDSKLFFAIVGDIIDKASRNGKTLHVFGEMVSLLWSKGNQTAAIQLEELWNNLQITHQFSLFCAYPMHNFEGKIHAMSFSEILKNHSRILPAESYNSLVTQDDRLREVVQLQQKAKSLESEIRKREQIEKQLRLSEIRYRRLFEASKDGIFILDFTTQKIIDTNPFIEVLLGYSRTELIGKNLVEIGFLKTKEENQATFEKLQQCHVLRWDNFSFQSKKGEVKDLEIVATIYKEDTNNVVQYTIRDVTMRQKLERQKDEFLSIASHELKTPVTSLKAYTQALQMKLKKKGDSYSAKCLEKMDGQINKLTELISDLLDVTKVEAGQLVFYKEKFSMLDVINEAIDQIQPTTTKHTIRKVTNKSIHIYGDKNRIEQVLTNFLSNAIKYSPDAKDIEVGLLLNKNFVTCYVKDYGVGIPKEKQTHLFERFYRVSGPKELTFPGLGLGLYISSEIIKRHNGRIWIESEQEKGSTFYFSIPLA